MSDGKGIKTLLPNDSGAASRLANPLMLLEDDDAIPSNSQLLGDITPHHATSHYHHIIQFSSLSGEGQRNQRAAYLFQPHYMLPLPDK
jgi:hypothetical protein